MTQNAVQGHQQLEEAPSPRRCGARKALTSRGVAWLRELLREGRQPGVPHAAHAARRTRRSVRFTAAARRAQRGALGAHHLHEPAPRVPVPKHKRTPHHRARHATSRLHCVLAPNRAANGTRHPSPVRVLRGVAVLVHQPIRDEQRLVGKRGLARVHRADADRHHLRRQVPVLLVRPRGTYANTSTTLDAASASQLATLTSRPERLGFVGRKGSPWST